MSLASILDRLAGQPVIQRRKRIRRPPRFYAEVLESRRVLDSYTVTSIDGGTGPGTLYDAFAHADAAGAVGDPKAFAINFNIPAPGVQTISLRQALPDITQPVVIDGGTQAANQGETSSTPLIDIEPLINSDGSKLISDGLVLNVGGNTIKDLIINNFAGVAIAIDGSADPDHGNGPGLNNIIQGNFIGTDPTGTKPAPNGTGITIRHSSYNLIGGPNDDGPLTDGNLISGNSATGIFLVDQLDTHNYIEGNYVGTDVTGTKPLVDPDGTGTDGIFLGPPQLFPQFGFASGNFIGNFDPLSNQFAPGGRNVISGNPGNGVYILGGTGNLVSGNYVGLGADGATPVPNGKDGVRLEDASANIIGGVQTNAGNVISANGQSGIEIVADEDSENAVAIPVTSQSDKGNIIQGNYIGTDATASMDVGPQGALQPLPLGNAQGIVLRNLATDPSVVVSLNIVGAADGDDGTVDGNVQGRNVISGNTNDGVLMAGPNIVANTLKGNYIGTDKDGERPLPNSNYGVELTPLGGALSVHGPSGNFIGTTTVGGGNLVSGNGTLPQGSAQGGGGGIEIFSSDANLVQNNRIGTDASGLKPLPNAFDGVSISGNANLIGGDTDTAKNVISGNSLAGVEIFLGTNNDIEKNFIGVGVDDSTRLPNQIGIEVIGTLATGNVIGGSKTVNGQEISVGNVISANSSEGISLSNGANANQVLGNMIGTDLTGMANLGNGDNGISIQNSSSNQIGGITALGRNVIVFNAAEGIDIEQGMSNVIEGDYIGLGPDGVKAEGNAFSGVLIDNSSFNSVGEGVFVNVISDNGLDGVQIRDPQSQFNVVAGCYIGTTADGSSPAPNGGEAADPGAELFGSGVVIVSGPSLNTIGGNGILARNVISGNTLQGIVVAKAGSGNAITNNYIGLNAAGTGLLAGQSLQHNGVLIEDTPLTVIGGTSFEDGGNVISGNQADGIFIGGPLSVGTQIEGNYIGTDKDATNAVANGRGGIDLASQSTGDDGPSSQTTVTGNTIAGNLLAGVALATGTTGNRIANNYISTNSAFSDAIANHGFGVYVSNSPGNFIGEKDAGNYIWYTALDPNQDPTIGSGFGIFVTGNGSTANQIDANDVFDNANAGIELIGGAAGNQIGSAQGNIIGRNLDGIDITGMGTDDNTVENNDIGIDAQGTLIGNTHDGIGILDGASNNVVGKAIQGGSNVISANGTDGVAIDGQGTTGNTVLGNSIGTDLQGKFDKDQDLGNGGDHGVGVDVTAPGNTIGGDAEGAGNAIVASFSGIALDTPNATDNVVEGNSIGNNLGNGVIVVNGASNNMIGGSDQDDTNEIRDNVGNGVNIVSGKHNSILRNQIFNNGLLGIALDQSNGANNLQVAPHLSLATTVASHRLAGWIQAAPNTTYTIEFFGGQSFSHGGPSNSEDDDAEDLIEPVAVITSFNPSTGQDETSLLRFKTVTTNSGGVALFDLILPDDVVPGTVIRATATDPGGNTSQFSNATVVVPDSDGDGVADLIESQAPDGDSGVSDRVASFQDALNQSSYITLTATSPQNVSLENVWSVTDPSPSDPAGPLHTEFGLGFVDFTIGGVAPGEHVAVTMTLPTGVSAPAGSTYWRYGNTPLNPFPHWYDWSYDPGTDIGAEIKGNTIILHFVNGARGDDDLDAENDTIEDAGSVGFPDPFTVTTTADSGAGSLRQAILDANANPGNDEITFDLPGSVPQIIQPLSPLPAITDPVTIDGFKLPSSEAGNDLQNTTPLVELDGNLAGAAADGLTFEVGGSIVRGLIVDNFSGDGIRLESSAPIDPEEFVGSTITGVSIEHNGGYGIEINDTPGNTIGSGEATGGNVISANAMGGIDIHGSDANDNSLTHNFIGTEADGTTPLGNGGPGVLISDGASGTGVGTDFAPQNNTIAFNAGVGVDFLSGASGFVQRNSIFANQGLGIDLGGDGVTPNDADDSDGVQNFPVLTSVASYGGHTYINGTIASSPQSGFTLDFYGSPAADPSGFGQGQMHLGSKLVFTDDSGQGSFALNFEQSVPPGWFITATASSFETSEFSAAVKVPALTPLVLTVNTPDDVDDATPDPAHFSLREAIEAANAHPGQDVIDFDLPDQTRTISPLSPLPNITDPVIIDGTSQFGYAGLPLVELDGSQAGDGANGLTITGGGSIVRGLVIHGFSGSGIELTGLGSNVVEGNFLGTDVTGTNYLPNLRADVFVYLSPDNLIGGTTTAARNVIGMIHLDGYNIDTGQPVENSGGNRVEGNYVGTDMTGTVILPGGGMIIEVSASNTIGGTAPGAGNLINGSLEIANSDSNIVQGNLIGTDFTGTVALSGSIDIAGEGLPAEFNQVGGDTAAARNIIVGQFFINGGTGSFNTVEGNYIGTDITGTVALGGKTEHDGITIEGSSNTIGGAEPGHGNLISGNSLSQVGEDLAGVALTPSAHDNFVLGNWIGTDVTGTKSLGNDIGIRNLGYDNTFGGNVPGTGNVISGNNLDGIDLGPDGGNVVEGNLIGTDYTGTKALGNGDGISGGNSSPNLYSSNLIGGTESSARNVISGNRGFGMSIVGSALVQGNYIGVDVSGLKPLGNGGMGVGLDQNSTLGGSAPGAGNVISANGLDGVDIDSADNVVQGNKIGTDATGTLNFGNGGDGISIITSYAIASDETIGGTDPGAGNVVAYNGGRGVSDPFGSGNVIRGNDIFANGDMGLITDIDGVMSTYAEQRGVRRQHSAPVLTSAVFDPQGTVVSGTLTGLPLTYYDIDFFANDSVPPNGFGDGQTYLQSIAVLMDASGSAGFQIPLNQAMPIGQWITATATPETPDGNTSQFSQATPVVAAVDPSDIEFTAPSYTVTENGGEAVVVVSRIGSTAGTATVAYTTSDGSATADTNYTTTAGTLTFNDGDSSETLTIPIQEDGVADGNKTFQLVLSNPTGADLGSLPSATITILDDDRAGQIALASSAFTIDQALNGDVFNLTRTGGSQGRVTVDYRVTGGTAIGSVRLPNAGEQLEADYVDAFGTVTFGDGQTTAQINLQRLIDYINGDPGRPEYKGPRTIELTIGNPTGGATLGDITTSTMTIQDEEDRAGAFLIDGPTSALESDGKVFLSIERVGNLFSVETIHYRTVDGTAKAGVNYTATAGTVTFNAEQSEALFSVPILDDGVVDDPGSFQVVISDPAGGAFLFDGLDRWTVQILDSDTPAPDQVVVSSSRFAEDANTAKILVQLLNGRTGVQDETHGAVTFNYATSDGTAKAGVDYTATSGTLEFFPGEPDVFITVPILPHRDASLDSTFFITLSNLIGDAVIGGDNPATQTLFQTNSPGQIGVSAAQYVVAEAKAGLTITVTFAPEGGDDATVWADYSTEDGTAQAGDRYQSVSGTLEFGSSESSDSDPAVSNTHTITIPILNNLSAEGTQTFYLKFTNLAGGASLGANGIVPITVLDEDQQPAPVTVSAGGPYTITEGDSLTLLATASGGSSPDLSWDINGDGVFGDAIGANPTLSWAQLQALGISDRPATYQVSVRATDLLNQVTSDPTSLTLNDVPVVGTGGFTYTAAAGGTPANEAVATFTDPPGAEALDNYSADIDWGDGTSSTAGDISFDAQVFTVSGEHTYADSGTFTIHVTLHHNSAADVTVTSTAAVGQPIPPSFTRLTSDLSNGSTYGQEVTFTATIGAASGTPTGSVDFVDTTTGRDLGSVQLTVMNGVNEASVQVSTLDVRSHTIVASYTSDTGNFSGSHDSLTQAVTPATLTVTADNKMKVSGTANPPLTETITGFVNGDTSTVVLGAPALSTTATSMSPVGRYPIVVGLGTLSAPNYTFALVNGTLTVTPGNNTPVLTLLHDTQAAATEGSSATLTSTLLETTDSDTSVAASTIVYTITAAPTLGTLADNGNLLAPGGSFSQQDIDDGRVTYQATEEGADAFAFSVASGTASPVTGTLAITASDPAVVPTGGFTYSATAGTLAASQTLATFTDPGGAESLADYAATIDWGDGLSATSGALSVDPNTHVFTVAGRHNYAAEGTFPIKVTLAHESANAVTVTSTAGIASATGTGEAGIAATGVVLNGYEFGTLTGVTVATFTDTDVSLSASDFGAVIDWGDGTTSAGSVALASDTYAVTGSHEYLDEGHYAIKVSIEQTAGPVTGGTSALVGALATIHEQRFADGTAGTPDQNYIQEIYRDLFSRQAEMQGLDYWVAELAQGVPRQQVAFRMVKIASFEEFQHDTVAALYEQYLGRVPDSGGLAYWSAYLYDGGTIAGMSQALVISQEYWQSHGGGTADGFLNALFRDALGRQIEPAALTYFEGLLAEGASAVEMAEAVLASDEYHRLRVNSFFEQFMNRPAEAGAQAYFAGELDDGERDEIVISQLLSSDEYYEHVQI